MEHPLVSIITPTFNAEKYVGETISSVIAQTYKNWELLITDDCSTDKTKEIVTHYSKEDSRIKLFALSKNVGAGEARNNSIKNASGRFMAFLDGDDLWLPNKLEKQIGFMLINNYPLSYTSYIKIEENGKEKGIIHVPEKAYYKDLLNTNVIATLTTIYDSEILGKCYMNTLKKRQDYCLWLSILKRIDFASGIDEVLAKYRVSKSSLSGNKLSAMTYQWKVYREIEKLGLLKSIYHFINYAFYGYLKYVK
ncbi:MAG: glycosyltransferase family 2 protein [Cyclobacteriaceae bacterium]|nr:glycosyltransferase family 2 protein [Cyclobacteriaceae bacterium]